MSGSDLRILVEEENNAQVVILSGDVDSHSSDMLRRKIRPLCEEQQPRVVIDCHDVGYVNSACLGRFHDFHKECSSNGGKLVFCRVDSSVMQVMDLLGLTQILTIIQDREEAIASVGAV